MHEHGVSVSAAPGAVGTSLADLPPDVLVALLANYSGPGTIEYPKPQRALSPLAMRISLYFICVAGILLNLAVFCKRKFRRRQSFTTRISLQLLCFMAVADTISLASLLLVLCTQYLGIQDVTVMDMICKVDLFMIHTASAFSIWCWLVLSAIRYVALYQPYAHLRLNKEPYFAVAFIAGMCGLFETWILYDATFVPEFRGCGEIFSEEWEKRFQVVEIAWSYFVPLILITVLDMRVICCHSIWFTDLSITRSLDSPKSKLITRGASQLEDNGEPSPSSACSALNNSVAVVSSVLSAPSTAATKCKAKVGPVSREEGSGGAEEREYTFPVSPKQSTASVPRPPSVFTFNFLSPRKNSGGSRKSKRRIQQMRILRRCLCITLLDLGMNLPNYLFRLYVNLVPGEQLSDWSDFWFGFVQDISQLLYFAQFSLNAFYLICIIYDTPKRRDRAPVYSRPQSQAPQ